MSFISRSCFESDGFKAYSNEIKEKKDVYSHIILYKKVPIFCEISHEPALIRIFLRNGHVRVKIFVNHSKLIVRVTLSFQSYRIYLIP